MKRWLFLLFTLIVFKSNAVTTYFYYVPFYDLESKPYIETYFTIVGNSIKYKLINNNYSGCVEITMLFKQEGNIKQFQKFNVSSPLLSDTLNKKDFIFVHRFAIEPGLYNLEIIIRDTLNKASNAENRYFDIIQIQPLSTAIQFSGVEFLEKIEPTTKENMLTKNGYQFTPYISDYFPANISKLQAYTEIYNSKTLNEDENILVRYYISKLTKDEPFNNFQITKKMKTSTIIPLIASFDISLLPSGNYNLIFELVNKENQVLARQKVFFQRNNPVVDKNWESIVDEDIKGSFIEPYNNIDSLKEFIRCLFPISSQVELDKALIVLKNKNINDLKKYILTFWTARNSLDPESEWLKYKELVNYVQRLYGNKVKKGYETDRGRVYLKYGAPNQVIESKHEPSAYPYEIWQYYVIGNQLNKKFVFYNPTLVGNDYTLLHSDVRGEVYDKNWERRLSSRNNSMYNFNATQSDDQYGSRAEENFNK